MKQKHRTFFVRIAVILILVVFIVSIVAIALIK